jgi:hypothetical protein
MVNEESSGRMTRIAGVLLTAAAVLMAVVFMMPSSGPTARTSLQMMLGNASGLAEGSGDLERTWSRNATRNVPVKNMPYGVHDYDSALNVAVYNRLSPAASSEKERRRPFEELALNYPERLIEIRAHQLRYASTGDVGLKRDNEVMAYFGESTYRTNSLIGKPARMLPDKNALSAFLDAADDGMRLDPENGYFAAMKAMALFANYQDKEGLKLLHTAAVSPAWDDYALLEAEARWRAVQKKPGSNCVSRTMIMASRLFPHFSRIRAMARLSDMLASKAEAAGDTARSLEIRHDTMLLGVNMRRHSHSVIGVLVGLAITKTGFAHTDGTKYAGMDPTEFQKMDSTQRTFLRLEAFDAYCKKASKPEYAAMARHEAKVADGLQEIIDQLGRGKIDVYHLKSLKEVSRSWSITTFALSNTVWLLLLGGVAGIARAVGAERKTAAAGAIGLLALAAILINLNTRWGIDLNKLDKSLGLLRAESGGGTGVKETPWSKIVSSPPFIQGSVLAASLALPALVLFGAGIAGVIKSPRGSYTLTRGVFVGSSVFAIAAAAWAVSQANTTARLESEQNYKLDRMASNELQYLAEQVKIKLPD